MTRVLTQSDRCDRCRAQAFVKVELGATGDVLLCGHHWKKHEYAVATTAAVTRIVDEREFINARPSPSV